VPEEQEPFEVPTSDHSLPTRKAKEWPKQLSPEEIEERRILSEAFLKMPVERFEVEEAEADEAE
jgi:hypothetical protein